MSSSAPFAPEHVRSLTNAILDRARNADEARPLTVVVGSEAASALAAADDSLEARRVVTHLYRGAAVAVVPSLHRWLVMVVPMISALPPDVLDPTSFYGDLRSNTFRSSLPPRT